MISSQPPVGGVIGGGGGDLSMFGGGGSSNMGGMDLFSLTTPTAGAYVAPKTVQPLTVCILSPVISGSSSGLAGSLSRQRTEH